MSLPHPPRTPSRTRSEVNGKKELVFPRDVQLHPFKPKIISVNWIRYSPGRYPGTPLDIPLKAINEERCPALREGGWLLQLSHKVPVYFNGKTAPDYLYMDLRGRNTGDKVMASDLDLLPGVTLVSQMKGECAERFAGMDVFLWVLSLGSFPLSPPHLTSPSPFPVPVPVPRFAALD